MQVIICINIPQTFNRLKSITEALEKGVNRSSVFIVIFEHFSDLFLVFLLLALNS